MTLDIFFECEVEGCNNQTRNSCGFCLGCHPVQEVEDFPCSIERQRDPLMPRELNNIEFEQIPVNFPVFPMMDNLDEIVNVFVDEEHVNLDMPDIEVNNNPPVMRREHAGIWGVPADR